MDLDARGELAGGTKILDDAGLDVAEAAIDGQQLRAQVEHGNVDGFAAFGAELIFGGYDDAAGQA